MKNKNAEIQCGDLVLIRSAVDGTLLRLCGVGLILEISFGTPLAPDHTTPRKTCTLLWHGEVERNIDVEWLMKLPLNSHEADLAYGENDHNENP